MSFVINGEETLANKEKYKFICKHRVPSNPSASIWSISFLEEFQLADDSIIKNYIEIQKASRQSFNIFNNLQTIGYNKIHNNLKLAKFVNSTPNLWHGYPADHVKNNQDRPTTETLMKMVNNNKITLRQMSIICRGKKL